MGHPVEDFAREEHLRKICFPSIIPFHSTLSSAEQKSSPKFIQEIREVRIKEGMKARFEAIFAGNPRPQIVWLFNGEELQGPRSIQCNFSHTLIRE